MDRELMKQYADFAVKVGVNVQPGQYFIIQCPIEGAEFARLCAAAAFEAGARDVIVKYQDERLSRLRMEKAGEEVVCESMPWQLRSYLDYAESEHGVSILNIHASDPEIYKGLDGAKVQAANLARRAAMKPWQAYTMNGKVQWCVAAIPTPAWAKTVFPGCGEEEAVEKLWRAIFTACRVQKGGDVVAAWQRHVAETGARRDKLNALDLISVRLVGENGTDLTIGLADDCVWEGGDSYTEAGVHFIANVPTEEVFTAPHRDKVNGVVKSTRPYVYNGEVIDGFTVEFKDGKAVRHSAEKGEELLGKLLDSDENSRRIGEIALVPASSPIKTSGILFYNTLFDENAACHIAFGKGYPSSVKGGEGMTTGQLVEKGVNDSTIHEDVMVGSARMSITGLTRTGETVELFHEGEWAI